MQNSDLVDALTRSAQAFERVFSCSDQQLERSYGEGKWTVRQLLAHLVDCEFINLYRFSKAVAEPGSRVDPFDENGWASSLRYSSRDAKVMGDLFRGARGTLIEQLRTLPAAVLDHASLHPEKGEMTAWRWAELTVGHGAHHLSQIDAALAGRAWEKPQIANSHLFGA